MMINKQLENQLRENAEIIFGQKKELPAGHRDRFEKRLKASKTGQKSAYNKKALPIEAKTDNNEASRKSGIVKSLKIGLITSVAVAAILIGIVFLLNPFYKEPKSNELADVRNYYDMLLEEQAEATRQLIQQVDEVHREILFANVKFIENEPIPVIQIPDDSYIILIASIYTTKIETLQNIQELIKATELQYN
jgi:hypothetical protein